MFFTYSTHTGSNFMKRNIEEFCIIKNWVKCEKNDAKNVTALVDYTNLLIYRSIHRQTKKIIINNIV